jgi:hypothetical protein
MRSTNPEWQWYVSKLFSKLLPVLKTHNLTSKRKSIKSNKSSTAPCPE